jgi:hypothetical protein
VDALELLRHGFEQVHGGLREDLGEVDDALLWWQPQPGLNHAGFLAWHVVRDEDDVLSHVAGQPQLWAVEGWHERFAMDRKEQGTGLDPARLESFRYDRGLFMEYAARVWARTGPLLGSLSDEALRRPAWPGSEWDVAQLLLEGCLGHSWLHLGELRYLKGLRGWRFRE